jgi:hypothetical protein
MKQNRIKCYETSKIRSYIVDVVSFVGFKHFKVMETAECTLGLALRLNKAIMYSSKKTPENLSCVILYTYIYVTHYNPFSWYLRSPLAYHPLIVKSPLHVSHNIPYYTDFKMINITHMISILNSVFTVVHYATRWTKLDITYICFN